MNEFQNTNCQIVRDLFLSSLWFLFIAVVNQKSRVPVMTIFPYIIPVIVIAWRYGIRWSFVLAALGTLAAMPADYMKSHDMNDLYWAAFTTYLKLSVAATGIVCGKNIATRHRNES